MSVTAWIDVAPLGRLLFRRGAVLGTLGVSAWVLGLGWIGMMLRFNGVAERANDQDFLPLLTCGALALVPLFVGALVGEAVHELYRRPATALLPALARRLRRSAFALAFASSALVALATSTLNPDLHAVRALPLALLGFATGAWVMVRMGGVAFWLARLSAVAVIAFVSVPLSGWIAGSTATWTFVLAIALFVLSQRFRPTILRSSLFSSSPTLLSTFARRERARRAASPPGPSVLSPPERLGGSVTGWVAARRFEQRTAGTQIGTFAGLLRFAFFATAMALLGPLFSGLADSQGEIGERARGLLAALTDALVGLPAAAAQAGEHGGHAVVITLGIFGSIAAWTASTPLVARLLYPLSRRTYARLAFRISLSTFFGTAVATWIAGSIVGGVLLALGGSVPRPLPVFVWIALANLALAPWLQIGVHLISRIPSHSSVLLFGAGLAVVLLTPVFLLSLVHAEWTRLTSGVPIAALVAGYLTAFALSLAALRRFLAGHFATCDLIKD